ncbi:Xanthine/uracil/thiamine/ascorbate permease family protein [Moritella sp. JT01]|uniref:NCS2 family permease n=1 Tax=Moritella sp. JT01 TaxID=756698 RepID=UPI000795A866|nr:NCS2 family permease [Moritella sp. JT01]KXO13061.1 Xanthine/uracil/thiamine/ascorbate permease family protein [Moritella sp. JT01]
MDKTQQGSELQGSAKGGILERLFKLSEHGTTVKTELMAGLTTFVTMAYIIFVNPDIMAKTGMDKDALVVATCIGAAIGCMLMGLYANWPVGLAPGMGLNAFFTYTVVFDMGYTWQVAMAAVFVSGVLFALMSFYKIREWILDSIPQSLRYAMTAGVGLFLGIIGFKSAGIVVASQPTLVTMGNFTEPRVLLAALTFLIIGSLFRRNLFGAVLIGMLVTTLAGIPLGLVSAPASIISMPPSIAPLFMEMDFEHLFYNAEGLFNVGMISVIISFLFVNMFDTAGTLMGVADKANLINEKGEIENLKKSLKADSVSSVLGACVGCPPVTSYVESASGVAAGGRTGLTAVTVGALFLAATFFTDVALIIPSYATAGALIFVSFLMMSGLSKVNWDEFTDYVPACITAIMMAFTFSIANGIALGFIAYTFLKVGSGKAKEVSISIWVLTAVFVAKLAFM